MSKSAETKMEEEKRLDKMSKCQKGVFYVSLQEREAPDTTRRQTEFNFAIDNKLCKIKLCIFTEK